MKAVERYFDGDADDLTGMTDALLRVEFDIDSVDEIIAGVQEWRRCALLDDDTSEIQTFDSMIADARLLREQLELVRGQIEADRGIGNDDRRAREATVRMERRRNPAAAGKRAQEVLARLQKFVKPMKRKARKA